MADAQCGLLIFDVSDRTMALRIEDVERIVPIAQLLRPPGLPSALVGVLNLGGTAFSVLRLARLLDLPIRDPGLYSMVVVLKKAALPTGTAGAVAVLVDRVQEILSLPESTMLPVKEEDSFNGCVCSAVSLADRSIHILSLPRLLLENEARALAEFQLLAERRLPDWEAASL